MKKETSVLYHGDVYIPAKSVENTPFPVNYQLRVEKWNGIRYSKD